MNQVHCKNPILIVEDDPKTSDLLSLYLRRAGFNTIAAYAGRQALDLATHKQLSLIILDILLPDLDGWDVCRRLRNASIVPILMLSALGEAHERVKGLTLGADDYVVKPFSPSEVLARVQALLRRGEPNSPVATAFVFEGLTVELEKRAVTLRGLRVPMTRSEFELLHALMATPGKIFERRELLRYLYPTGGIVIDRVIDVHIGNLRQKIEDDPANPRYILTARGVGYRFTDGRDHSEKLIG